jgi:hypothetical protein
LLKEERKKERKKNTRKVKRKVTGNEIENCCLEVRTGGI